jgi:hypothetical protein
MTEAKATGAVSREPEGWYDIDLKRAYRNVRRLQARIEGNSGRQMEQSEGSATSADPLVQCQSAGSETGDGK